MSRVHVLMATLPGESEEPGVEVLTDDNTATQTLSVEKYGKLFKVVIHNDHFTSMEFVVRILMEFFGKNLDQAYRIMMYVHKNGKAVAGIYSKEIAETKIAMVRKLAEENDFPLTLTLEKTT